MKTKLNSMLNQLRRLVGRVTPCAPTINNSPRSRRAEDCPPYQHTAARRGLMRPAILALCLATALAARAQTPMPPVVTSVTASQVQGTNLVLITYILSDTNFTSDNVFFLVSTNSGASWTVPAATFTGSWGTNVSSGYSVAYWNAGKDWDGQYDIHCRVRVLANNVGLVLIPPGTYLRGNAMSADTDITDAPQYPVYVSAFYMDSTLVTGGKWNFVMQGYASSHGYNFDNPGSFKASSHPVQTVNWYDCAKWCNARSEMEGLTPCYYTNPGFSLIYTNGDVDALYVLWGANGYRLPTEAEWEKAARGGATGHRFPWSDTDNISESRANYSTGGGAPNYDLGGTQTYATGSQPYTSPVGSFPANGYGLFDMAGNVNEWCWDWYGSGYYSSGPSALTNPQGPSSGSARVLRGGSCFNYAFNERCAYRADTSPANTKFNNVQPDAFGFRCVRGVP
jgi:formylglycine-generating enzyme required for sulfatase activity